MRQITQTLLALIAFAGCSFTTAQAETIVQWGASGGEKDIVSPQQSFTVSDTYTVSTAVNPTVGASYYPNNTGRTPVFNAAYGNATGSRTAMVRDFNPDVIAIGMNTGTTAPGSLATNEVMVVWESSNFLSVSGSYTLDSITFEGNLNSDGSGTNDLSVYRFILEDVAGNFHISQEFDQANDNSAYTTHSAAAGALTWSAYTPFDGGGDVIGAASSPSLTDFKAIGLYTAVADADHNWAQYQTRFFKVDVTVATGSSSIVWDGGAADDSWSSVANWNPDEVPGEEDDIVISNATVEVESNFIPAGATLNLTGSATLNATVSPIRLTNVGTTINVGSEASISNSAAGFWDIRGTTLNFDSGAMVDLAVWELKNEPTLRFNLDSTGFATIGGGRMKSETNPSNITWVVDFSNYTNGSQTVVLMDFDTNDSGTATDMTAELFQAGTVTLLNAGYCENSTLAWNETTHAVELSVVYQEPETITWDGGAGSKLWSAAQNWNGDTVPANGDNVVITTTGYVDVSLTGVDFTVKNGRSLTFSGSGTEFILEGGACSLTLATGGAIDLDFVRPRYSGGGQLIIEPDAALNTVTYGLGATAATVKYIANATGVTMWSNSGAFDPRLDNLIVDLSNYDTANGDTLVLVDYGSLGAGYEFASVTLTESWSGTIDYAYDQGGGDLAIALTGIEFVDTNGTPESWLDLYGLVTGGDYEAAGLLDSDGDGKLNWEEYRDGTDPTGVGVAAPIPFTLVEGTNGDPDTLTFSPPNTTWHIEASTDDTVWGVVPHMTFVVNADGTITASVEALPALNAGGTYRVIETQKNRKLVIFLTEGQSNMEGASSNASSNVYGMEDHPLPNMLQLSRARPRDFYDVGAENELIRAFQPLQTTIAQNPDAQTQYESNSYTALDFYFARAYAADHPDEDVLIVRNAVGGTGFRNNNWNDGDVLDLNVTPYLQAALAQVSGEYATIEFGGILWHQGEADANASEVYGANLVALVSRHRGYVEAEIANSSAPFICGTMVSRWIELRSLNYGVDAVHRNIANLVPNSACVDLADLDQVGYSLTNHFLVDEYKVAGLRYYEAWLEVQGITGKGTPRAWLDAYGLVVDGDYAAADVLDSDGDGKLNWEEYLDGTNPTGPVAAITFAVAAPDSIADTLNFIPPSTPWVVEASADDTVWGVVPHMSFVVNADGTITATVEELPALSAGGTYRITEKQQNRKLVIFLTEGQSNMVGYAPDTDTHVYGMADHPLPNMLQLSHGHARHFYDSEAENALIPAFQPLQASEDPGQSSDEADTALDFYFARAYAEDHPNEDVLIIKNAFGGSGFGNGRWNDGDDLDALVTPYFEGAFNQNDLSNRYETIEFGGILWHQGEADTKAGLSGVYAANLTAMVERHRSRVDAFVSTEDTPFILGTMHYYRIDNYYSNFPEMTTVDAVHRDIANLVPNADFVDLHDLQGNTTIHFSVDEYKTMGARYYQKWLELSDTSNGTPYAWLQLYGLVSDGDYEAADLLDSDSDGRLNWQEYQDGTDPTGVGVAAPIPFTLVDATDGSADTLTFSPPNTKWVIEASSDDVEWGVVPQVTFFVNVDGSITATAPQLETLNPSGTYRVVETSENTKLVIFLTEGQSNMVGWSGKTSYEMDDYPTPNMFQLSRGLARLEYAPGAADSIVQAFQPLQTTVDRSGAATSRFVSLDFYFAREYAKAHPNEDVLIVKNARGGTGFVNNYWNAGNSLDVLADPYLAAALAQVSGEYTTIEFGGILWHQGEADAANATSAAAYAANLTALFARHRAVVANHFSGAQAPVVIGTMVPANIQNNSTGYYDDIDAIHRDISNLVADAGFADLSSISGEAEQHFLADGYQTAGELYYQKWLELETQIEQEQTWLDVHGLVTEGDYAAAMDADSDGDGKLNWEESLHGTHPAGHLLTEIPSLDLIVGDISSDDTLTFMPPNTAWVLKVSGDLNQWDDVSEALFAINADGSVTVNTAHDGALSKRFYRLIEVGW